MRGEIRLNRFVMTNWKLGNFFYFILKGYHHKISKKPIDAFKTRRFLDNHHEFHYVRYVRTFLRRSSTSSGLTFAPFFLATVTDVQGLSALRSCMSSLQEGTIFESDNRKEQKFKVLLEPITHYQKAGHRQLLHGALIQKHSFWP